MTPAGGAFRVSPINGAIPKKRQLVVKTRQTAYLGKDARAEASEDFKYGGDDRVAFDENGVIVVASPLRDPAFPCGMIERAIGFASVGSAAEDGDSEEFFGVAEGKEMANGGRSAAALGRPMAGRKVLSTWRGDLYLKELISACEWITPNMGEIDDMAVVEYGSASLVSFVTEDNRAGGARSNSSGKGAESSAMATVVFAPIAKVVPNAVGGQGCSISGVAGSGVAGEVKAKASL